MSWIEENISNEINSINDYQICGEVENVVGLLIEIVGIQRNLAIGGHCTVVSRQNREVICEVV